MTCSKRKIIEIGKYRDDRKKIKNFILSILREFGFNYDPKYDKDLNNLASFYKEPNNFRVLLEDQKRVIGTIAITKIKPKVAELKRFYVDKEYRGRGLGNKLFKKAIDFCQKNNLQTIVLETTPNMVQAIKFYKRQGFTISKKEKGHIWFRKTL